MPRLSLPNRVTVMRILLIVPFVLLLLYQNQLEYSDWARRAALVFFLVMACSDALDGYLARRIGQRSRLGYFLDPMADKLLITAACILLSIKATGVKGALLPGWVVVVIIGKDILWLAGVLVIQFLTGKLAITPSSLGKACTFAQLAMVTGTLLFPDLAALCRPFAWWLTRILWVSAAGLAVMTLANYTRVAIRLLAESPNHNEKSSGT